MCKEESESTLTCDKCKSRSEILRCKHTLHRPVDKASGSHPQLSVSVAASAVEATGFVP